MIQGSDLSVGCQGGDGRRARGTHTTPTPRDCLISLTNNAISPSLCDISKITRPIFPSARRRAAALGERLRLARLRRRMTVTEMAARVDASRTTIYHLERGDLSVSLAILVRVLAVLGLEEDLDLIVRDDLLGQRLQDLSLRQPRKRSDRA